MSAPKGIVWEKKYEYESVSEVSMVGIGLINDLLRRNGIRTLPGWFSREYIGTQETELGKFRGKFAKRVAQCAAAFSIKIPPHILTQIGNIAASNAFTPARLEYDFTDAIYWEPGEFGYEEEDSCFWSNREAARYAIMDNDGFAIRVYNEYGAGIGRAFIFPAMPDCYIVFNGYCDDIPVSGTETRPIIRSFHPTLAMATILAKHIGGTTKHIRRLVNHGTPDGILWINGDDGYLVGPKDSLDLFNEDTIDLEVDVDGESYMTCSQCGGAIPADAEDFEVVMPDGDIYCRNCFEESDEIVMCLECNNWWLASDHRIYKMGMDQTEALCPHCVRALENGKYIKSWCSTCEEYVLYSKEDYDDRRVGDDGETVCERCFYETPTLRECDNDWRHVTYYPTKVKNGSTDLTYCPLCAHLYSCSKCDRINNDLQGTYLEDGSFICEDCAGGYQLPLTYLEGGVLISDTFRRRYTIEIYYD